jgi:hypothetical protein
MATYGLAFRNVAPNSGSLGPTMIRLKLDLLRIADFDWQRALRTLPATRLKQFYARSQL